MKPFPEKTPQGFPEYFVGWPVIGIQFRPEIVSQIHFGLFHCESCGLS